MSLQTPLLFAPGDGDHWNLLNSVATVKVGGKQTDGLMTVIETVAPRGFGPPLHRHDVEDELFHVTEGALWVSCAGQEQVVEAGGTAWLPKGLPHQFQAVGDGDTRFLQITTPAQFEDMVAALGARLDAPRITTPAEIDPARVAQVCAEFQIEILGPPPPPLD
jgi:quercetin dioxygenase-like cupin family protein